MYNTEQIAGRIKKCAKEKGILIKTMLSELGLGVNAISQLAAGKGMSYLDFARIADYLSVSIDFLLSRSEMSELFGDEKDLLLCYRQLGDVQKETLRSHASDLAKLARLEESN